MKENLLIFGTGSFAELAQFYFTNDSDYNVIAFTVHADHQTQKELNGLPVIPYEKIRTELAHQSFKMFVAIAYTGVNRIRAAVCEAAKRDGHELVTYISSKCTYWGQSIGENCFIFEDNTIQPFVNIGDNVILWSGNHIGHHSTIGDHCFIASHVVISGHVTVSPYCFIGVNATIRDDITIGESCVIGAGSLILKSTEPKQVYIGKRTLPASRTSDQIRI